MATATALPTPAQPGAVGGNATRPREQGRWQNTVSTRRPELGSVCAVVADPEAEQLGLPAAIAAPGWCAAPNRVPGVAASAFLEASAVGDDLGNAIAARIGIATGRRRIVHHGRRWG